MLAWMLLSVAFRGTDTIETFFDSRMDLLERRLKKHYDKLKLRAEEASKFKPPSGELFAAGKDIDKEVQKFKLKVNFITCILRTFVEKMLMTFRYFA